MDLNERIEQQATIYNKAFSQTSWAEKDKFRDKFFKTRLHSLENRGPTQHGAILLEAYFKSNFCQSEDQISEALHVALKYIEFGFFDRNLVEILQQYPENAFMRAIAAQYYHMIGDDRTACAFASVILNYKDLCENSLKLAQSLFCDLGRYDSVRKVAEVAEEKKYSCLSIYANTFHLCLLQDDFSYAEKWLQLAQDIYCLKLRYETLTDSDRDVMSYLKGVLCDFDLDHFDLVINRMPIPNFSPN